MATIYSQIITRRGGRGVQGGWAYCLFEETQSTVREIIGAQVVAQCKKAIDDPRTSCIDDLVDGDAHAMDMPTLVARVMERFQAGEILIVINKVPATDLNQQVIINWKTKITFELPSILPRMFTDEYNTVVREAVV